MKHDQLSKWIGLTLLVLLSACGKQTDQGIEQKPVSANSTADVNRDPSVVMLNNEMAARMVVGHPSEGEFVETLNVPGKIEVDEHRLARIGSSVTGRVVEILANLGDSVSAGKVLAKITSPELTNAQLTYLRAASSSTLAEKSVERARQLFAADVIGSAELQKREAESQVARAELNAASDQLLMLGMSKQAINQLKTAGDIQPALPVIASRAGIIIERKVNVGQVVQPADQLFSVADLGSVWAVGGVPEQIASAVAVKQIVDIEIPALKKTVSGRIVFVGDTVQPETRTVTVRTEINNSEKIFKPSMLANLKITASSQQRLTVPVSAVVRENDRDFVYVKVASNQFKMTEIHLGLESQGLRPVIKGVSKYDDIVLDGAFHLNNERKRAELE